MLRVLFIASPSPQRLAGRCDGRIPKPFNNSFAARVAPGQIKAKETKEIKMETYIPDQILTVNYYAEGIPGDYRPQIEIEYSSGCFVHWYEDDECFENLKYLLNIID